MATPYVAGILAYVLSEYGQVTPASLSASLKSHAQAVVTGAPSGTTFHNSNCSLESTG
ncbi:cuticle-degrading protease [Rhizoctonia solani]|uniref:Cuticle-degrading protease n=1 Tax=Rhizoctonia solani TaxID=456999 RepID=A0A8H8NQI8_9AGAM|nr:cuticle-degrading protease [Rhizoctonia solani]QRW16755.1 cuticle-degrading protease [Rhizoctonia solani]